MGKWTDIVKNLPKALEEDDYQAKIELAKATITDRTPGALAALYLETRRKVDVLKEQQKPLNILTIALEQLIDESYVVAGITSLKLADGSTVRTQLEPSLSFDRDDPEAKDKFRKWCIENGYENLFALPTPTRDSLVRDLLLEGSDVPPGIAVKGYTKVVLTKGKE